MPILPVGQMLVTILVFSPISARRFTPAVFRACEPVRSKPIWMLAHFEDSTLGISCEYAADNFELLISLQLPLAPMCLFAIGPEFAHVAMQRLHYADARKHCRPAEIGDQNQASIAACAASRRLSSLPPSGRAMKSRSQPLLMAPTLLVEFDKRAGQRPGRVA
jgi:hypothetical protein